MFNQLFPQSPIKRVAIVASLILSMLALVLFSPLGFARADFSYTVKAGDTLSKIAKVNNTTVEALVAANKAKYPCLATNPACLQIGWVLNLGSNGNTSSAANSPSTYTVQSGDSLAKIAKKLGVNFNDLITANKKDRPCLAAATPCALQIGWVLNVPGGVAPTAFAAAAPVSTTVPTAAPVSAPVASETSTGTLAIQMCLNAEATVTIFHAGQIVSQGSIHSDTLNTYVLPAGHYDVQFNGAGYYNYNFSEDLAAGQTITETITCG
jgi:LysM repeat protein